MFGENKAGTRQPKKIGEGWSPRVALAEGWEENHFSRAGAGSAFAGEKKPREGRAVHGPVSVVK